MHRALEDAQRPPSKRNSGNVSEKKKADAAKPGVNSAKEIALQLGEVRPDVKNHARTTDSTFVELQDS